MTDYWECTDSTYEQCLLIDVARDRKQTKKQTKSKLMTLHSYVEH